MEIHIAETQPRGLRENRNTDEDEAARTGPFAVFGIGAVILVFVIVLVTSYELVSILLVPAGIKIAFGVPYYFRFCGIFLLGIGLAFVGWVFRYRHPKDFFASTWITIRKGVTSRGIEETRGRAEPFVPRGPYLYVRNPTYFGGIAALFGGGIAAGSAVLLVWGLLMTLLFWSLIIPYEEKELEFLFGETYAEYRRAVPKLFPNGKKYRKPDGLGSHL